MDKASVIAIRDALLNNGENRSVRVIFDNGFNLSHSSDITIWNDDAEIVIGFTASGEGGYYSADLPIQVVCSTYENIQFITGNANVNTLEKVIDALNVVTISDDDKAKIMEWYDKVYSHKYELSRKNYDPVDIQRD